MTGEVEDPLIGAATDTDEESGAGESVGVDTSPPTAFTALPTTAWSELRGITVSVTVVQLVEKTVVVGSSDGVMEAITVM